MKVRTTFGNNRDNKLPYIGKVLFILFPFPANDQYHVVLCSSNLGAIERFTLRADEMLEKFHPRQTICVNSDFVVISELPQYVHIPVKGRAVHGWPEASELLSEAFGRTASHIITKTKLVLGQTANFFIFQSSLDSYALSSPEGPSMITFPNTGSGITSSYFSNMDSNIPYIVLRDESSTRSSNLDEVTMREDLLSRIWGGAVIGFATTDPTLLLQSPDPIRDATFLPTLNVAVPANAAISLMILGSRLAGSTITSREANSALTVSPDGYVSEIPALPPTKIGIRGGPITRIIASSVNAESSKKVHVDRVLSRIKDSLGYHITKETLKLIIGETQVYQLRDDYISIYIY